MVSQKRRITRSGLCLLLLSAGIASACATAPITGPAPVAGPASYMERCTVAVGRRDAGVHVAHASAPGPRLALQIARVWCFWVANSATGAVEITGNAISFSGWESAVQMGRLLADDMRNERESDAAEPFVCAGPGESTPPHNEIMGMVEGPGVRIVDPAPVETRVMHPASARDAAKQFCATTASRVGAAGVIGRSLIVRDYPEVLQRLEMELALDHAADR